ncbi:MAG: hypothetical protein Q7R41_08210 [Phycisphaerales bacterium]|nr:hypothetical protein [Phycisphaerales bacterium]
MDMTLDQLREARTADGKFRNRPGPGRPSKRLIALRDRYRGETMQEVAALLSADIPILESELAGIDADVAEKERTFFDSLAPALKHRAEVAITLARARTAVHYLSDPSGFAGATELPTDAALREYEEAAVALREAEAELADNPDPGCDRIAALADADSWDKLHRFEKWRDTVDELRGKEMRARNAAEAVGHILPPMEGTTMLMDVRSSGGRSWREGMGEL